jgi:hypothetical protein
MSNPKQAPAGSGHPVGGPARSERPVNVPGGSAYESVEEDSPFVSKALDSQSLITTQDMREWAEDPNGFLKDINTIVKSYRTASTKLATYKKKYGDAKGAFENNQLHLVTLEEKHITLQEEYEKLKEDNQRYKGMVDRLMQVPAALSPSPSPEPSQSRQGSPGGVRVAKLPDPTLFAGDRTVFDDWLVQIKNKLRGNADSYPSEDLKIIYVSSRLTGNALALTNPRMDEDSPNRYRQLSELYDHLKELYSDPNKMQNARREFHKLQMRSGHVFQEFYALFLRLSTEGGISSQDLKYELNEKLTMKLQESVRTYYNDSSVNATCFAQYCTTNDQQIRAMYEKAKEYKKTVASPAKFSTSATPPYPQKEPISTALVKYVPPHKRK